MTDNMDIVASGFDYNCNLNWRINGQQIPATPPCVSSDVTIPAGAFFLSTFGNPGAASSISTDQSAVRTTECDPATPNELLFDPDPVVIEVRDCRYEFQFTAALSGGQAASQFRECAQPVCAAVTWAVDEDGNTVQVVTAGPNAGTAYVLDTDSGTVRANTMAVSNSTDGVRLYTWTNITVSETGEVIPAVAIDSSSSGSDASDDGGSSIIIIIVVVALILIIGIVVFVFVVVKKQNEAGPEQRGAAGGVSFENPMYDEADTGGAAPLDQGMYDEPEMAGNSGYMDVPAGEEDGFAGSSGCESVFLSVFLCTQALGESRMANRRQITHSVALVGSGCPAAFFFNQI